MVTMRGFFTIDLRDAVRSLRRTPVVTVIAVVSLALGIGANTALFSILDSLALKALPVRDPARLVLVGDRSWTNPIWEQIRERRQQLFADAFAWSEDSFNLALRGRTDFVDGAWASGGMFDVLGVHALIGRTFTTADDARDGGPDGPVAVVSYRFWERRFGGAPDAVGRQLSINGVSTTVIGVAPPGFFGPDVGRTADVIVPIGIRALVPGEAKSLDNRAMWWLSVMARLRPGQTAAEAAAQLDAVRPQIRAATLPPDWPAAMQARYLSTPLALVPASTGESDLRREYLTPLEIVLGVVGAVLLIACANLASLLLARAASRRHELSVRLALGASRFRLTKLLLLESGLLAAGGAGLGLMVAKWGSALLVRQLTTDPTGVTLDLSFDWRVLAFTTGIAALTALLFGLAPALGVGRVAPNEVMKEHSHSVIGDRRFGVRSAIVVGQVALSLALVVAAALFVRTLAALTGAPLGFTPDRLLSARLDARAGDPGREELLSIYERVTASAAAVPGVANAAISVLTPVSHRAWNTVINADPDAPASTAGERLAWVNVVSPGWFGTFGMHVLNGRDFDDHDAKGAERVAVVNESFARRFLPGRSPVGMQIRTDLEGADTNAFRIVGVVNDSVYESARAGFAPTLYVPLAQLNRVMSSAVLTVRAERGEPDALAHDLADAIARADRTVAFTIDPVSEQVSASIRQERLVAMLAGFFGALALLLAAIGLYGVASHSVNQRRAEIGIRMALGADASGVIRLVLARLTMLLAGGVAAGVALSWWTSRFVATLLFGLGPRDPATFAAAAALLVSIGLLAGWIPARRAARIDPVRVLREG
jgi:putative ABC transport system permease protein